MEAKTRMWVVETDQYGMTDRKFYVDDPIHVPRVGEFVDSDEAAGRIEGINWYYLNGKHGFDFPKTIIYVFLKPNVD